MYDLITWTYSGRQGEQVSLTPHPEIRCGSGPPPGAPPLSLPCANSCKCMPGMPCLCPLPVAAAGRVGVCPPYFEHALSVCVECWAWLWPSRPPAAPPPRHLLQAACCRLPKPAPCLPQEEGRDPTRSVLAKAGEHANIQGNLELLVIHCNTTRPSHTKQHKTPKIWPQAAGCQNHPHACVSRGHTSRLTPPGSRPDSSPPPGQQFLPIKRPAVCRDFRWWSHLCSPFWQGEARGWDGVGWGLGVGCQV